MDSKAKLTPEQAKALAEVILAAQPRIKESWLGAWARAWAERPHDFEPASVEFNPLVHPGSPRWSAYNSIFDSWRR